ncbi:LLM class flavin-dependent oxidoreductase [Dactylosporangium sp. NPDC051541]|uniref:LLM class flavin-dependent oxidoreductase n=1 Tax=Dactylosporangium sp. NPDC051541 TaxID=3363977 RepID=UPI00378ADD0B
MYVSVFMGPFSMSAQQDLPNIELCLRQAEAAAAAGFAMVTFGEQHFNNYEPYCNPFLMAARLAPNLGETWFGTTIVPLVLHHPFRLAEDSSVVDLLLRGRFIMGMSAGRVGFSPDFQNFGLDPARRHEIFESKLDLLQRAYAHAPGDQPIVMDTEWDRGELNGRLMPVSWRAGGPLLAVGTNTDATIETTAGRGLAVFLGPCLRFEAAAKLARYRRVLADAGHDPDTIETMAARCLVTRHVIVDRTDDEAWQRAEVMAGRNPLMDRSTDTRSLRELAQVDLSSPDAVRDPANRNAVHVQSWILAGTPDSVTAQLRAYADAGVPQVLTRFTVGAYDPQRIADSFQLFVDEVLPNLDAQRFPAPTGNEIRAEHRPADDRPADINVTDRKDNPMSASGTWNATIDTPIGKQQVVLQLSVDGAAVTGTATQNGATNPLLDGAVDGDDLTWKSAVQQPFPMTLTYKVSVSGDEMSGTAQAGQFPPARLTGKRA